MPKGIQNTKSVKTEAPIEEAVVEAPKKAVKKKREMVKVFYCKDLGYTFYVNVLNKDGETVQARDNKANELFRNGNPVLVEKQYFFAESPSTTQRGGFIKAGDPDKRLSSFIVWSDMPSNVLEVLEDLRADSSNSIMDEDEFEKSRNETAYEARKEASAFREENIDLKAEIERLKNKG